jgi:HSP20 family protein
MGERYAPLIDPYHFWGMSAFDIKRKPAVNIKKKGHLFEFQVAVPGYKKEELEVVLENGYLIIRGEKEKFGKEDTENFIVEEFDFDSFERSFRLHENIAEEKVHARYEEGILYIEIDDVPKEEEKAYQMVDIM